MSTKIIKLAGCVKPPARKSEVIEALAIRKREQIIEENKKLSAELEQLRAKIQVVASEEAAANSVLRKTQNYYVRATTDSAGRLTVGKFSVNYDCEPSAELRDMAKRLYTLERMGLHHTPSLHEVRQQVRAKVMQQTPPDGRVQELLKNPMLDSILEKLDGKPQQALIA